MKAKSSESGLKRSSRRPLEMLTHIQADVIDDYLKQIAGTVLKFETQIETLEVGHKQLAESLKQEKAITRCEISSLNDSIKECEKTFKKMATAIDITFNEVNIEAENLERRINTTINSLLESKHLKAVTDMQYCLISGCNNRAFNSLEYDIQPHMNKLLLCFNSCHKRQYKLGKV